MYIRPHSVCSSSRRESVSESSVTSGNRQGRQQGQAGDTYTLEIAFPAVKYVEEMLQSSREVFFLSTPFLALASPFGERPPQAYNSPCTLPTKLLHATPDLLTRKN